MAKNNRRGCLFTDLTGWCEDSKIAYMMDLVKSFDNPKIVEIGVWGGKSLIPMAYACTIMKSGHVYGIDPWDSKDSSEAWDKDNNNYLWWSTRDHNSIYNSCLAGISKHGVEKHVTLIRKRSDQAVDDFSDESLDIIHLDGNHAEPVCYSDVCSYVPKLKQGGYWIQDDVNWPSTLKGQKALSDLGLSMVHQFLNWAVYRKGDPVSAI